MVYLLFEKTLLRTSVIITITPITANIASIPESIYLRLAIKFIGAKSLKTDFKVNKLNIYIPPI